MEPLNNISQEITFFQIESLPLWIKYNFLEDVPTRVNMALTSRQLRAHAAGPVGKIARVVAHHEAKKSGKAFEKAFHFFELALQAVQDQDKVTAKKALLIARELALQIQDLGYTESLVKRFSENLIPGLSPERQKAAFKNKMEEDSIQSQWDAYLKNCALSEILIIQARIGDLEEAQATLKNIQDIWGIQPELGGALVELACAQAKSGKMLDAEATIKNIQDPSLKDKAWSKLVEAQAQQGISLEIILLTLRNIDDFKTNSLAWLRAALILEIPEKEILTKIDATLLDSALAEIAGEKTQTGDIGGAEKIIGRIKEQWIKEHQLILVALKKVLKGDTSGARKTLTEIKISMDWALVNPEYKRMRLIWLGRAIGQTGDLEEAKKMFVDAIKDAERISDVGTLVDVSLAQARCGDQAGAKVTLAAAQKIAIANDGDQIGLIKIGRAYEQLGHLNEAKARIKNIKATSDSSLKMVAIAQAGIGDIEGAKETINRMTGLAYQLSAVGSLFGQRRETFEINNFTK